MKLFDTNKKLNAFYEDGQLPTLSYIYHHRSDEETIIRPLHSHQDICEIIVICEGSCVYYQSEVPHLCEAGTVICTNQDELHELNTEESTETSWYSIGITNLRKKGLPKNHLFAFDEPCTLPAGENRQLVENFLYQMYKLVDRNEKTDLLVQTLCTSFIILIDQIWHERDSSDRKADTQDISKRMIDYLDNHYTDENISINEIALALNCSETHVSHLFKKVTGQSPKQYIIRRRIGHAQTLLISTDLSVTEIASDVGYNNTNYFSTIFSEYTGVTPVKYRKIYKQKAKGSYYQL